MRWPNVGLMVGHRLRRWPNISPTLGQRLAFVGITFMGSDSVTSYYEHLPAHIIFQVNAHIRDSLKRFGVYTILVLLCEDQGPIPLTILNLFLIQWFNVGPASQMVDLNPIMPTLGQRSLQSAYRKNHSTESPLLKVHNDIIRTRAKLQLWPCLTCRLFLTPLTCWPWYKLKFGLLLIWKNRHQPKIKTLCQIKSHSQM